MATGDAVSVSKQMTYSRSGVPVIGALIDYMDTSLEYLRCNSFARAESLNPKSSRTRLSASFMALVCLLLGLACNVKFEVVTFDEEPLTNDLHFVLMSKDDKLYIDDIDVSRVMLCIEASDTLVLLISTLLIWNSSNVRSPLSEYLFLPWLGASLRGLFLRQAPTVGALLYVVAVINGNVNSLFLTAFSFLLLKFCHMCIQQTVLVQHGGPLKGLEALTQQRDIGDVLLLVLEARLWLEIARMVRIRWERRDNLDVSRDVQYEVETLWSNEDVQSVEVGNYVY